MGKVELSGEDGTMNKIVLQLQFISLISLDGGVLAKIGKQKYGNNGSRNVSILSDIFNWRTVQFGCGQIVEATLHFRLLKTMNRNILAECKRQMFKQILIFPKGIDNNISLNNPVCNFPALLGRQDENMTSLEYIAISYKAYY